MKRLFLALVILGVLVLTTACETESKPKESKNYTLTTWDHIERDYANAGTAKDAKFDSCVKRRFGMGIDLDAARESCSDLVFFTDYRK